MRGGNPRVVAQRVLVRVERDGAYADRALNAALERSHLTPRDRGLATELVYGTLRHRGTIDFVLGELTDRPLRKVAPAVLAALRLGAYQILHTRVPARAAVNESVDLVRRDQRHASGFVNAVLRKVATLKESDELPDPTVTLKDPIDALAVATSHPRWILDEVRAQRSDQAMEAWAIANNIRPELSLRVRSGSSRDEFVEKLQANHSVTVPELFPDGLLIDGGRPTELPGFAEGSFSVQDLAAQLVARLGAPAAGSFVLDCCAAPGGKAMHLAELMGDEGTVLALDIHPAKTRLIQQAADRLDLTSVKPAAADASDPDALEDLLFDHQRDNVDLVVLDAPCTGMGTLRRNPELRSRDRTTVAELAKLQDALLDSTSRVLAPGGTMVYAVCTVTRAEGPERIRELLERNDQMEVVPVTDPILEPFIEVCNDISPGAQVVRTWTDVHGCDSFFMVRMRRK